MGGGIWDLSIKAQRAVLYFILIDCLDILTLIYPFFPRSPSLWETARYRLKYCLKGPLHPKPTNQLNILHLCFVVLIAYV